MKIIGAVFSEGLRWKWGHVRWWNLETELVYMECLLELSYGPQVTILMVTDYLKTRRTDYPIDLNNLQNMQENSPGFLLVLGEYGAADGKFSASYSTGKLRDVAEAYSNDETVKVSLFSWKVL
ncbi:hypothetical protein Patl1_21940 [Pistacia atlantica]|uniref:Uncharacterized protein n=1 Tax=Pistacia atlantica TaxID=434234 RepID=A0ACC1BNV8_9ROSI|nr:hypothetical protein Patl1_21940 [Pistacia atlantica]